MKYTFNEWRDNYNSISYNNQKDYYNELEKLYPHQAHYDLAFALQVFDYVKPQHITEAGGWKGDLANIILAKNSDIISWKNIEICEEAINNSKCNDTRFTNYIPDSFDWFNANLYNGLFLSTHFIEHISNNDFDKLADSLRNVEYIYLESPLENTDTIWTDYFGTHILGYGWDNIKEKLSSHSVILENNYCKLFHKI
jgi:hypothetical protein